MDVISFGAATVALLAIIGAVIVFHLLVIGGILPKTIVWAGRISDPARLVRAEMGSIAVLLVAATFVIVRWRSLAHSSPPIVAGVGAWVLVILFTLNTVGNLFAKTRFERIVFTPLTLLLAVLMLRLALE